MSLPEADTEYLNQRGIAHEVTSESGMTCVVFPSWPLPAGFDHGIADLLIRLGPGYPDVHPDMWWFDPPVRLANGQSLPQTEVFEPHLGRSWQRWSRHLSEGHWQSGVDCLESFMALIRRHLEQSAPEKVV
ncbi:MAG: hypothetical protein HYX64_01135 [Gammaproteobacteria bacterium]|nr:hypothetical protein [Gammaproteobacteria bacterium]